MNLIKPASGCVAAVTIFALALTPTSNASGLEAFETTLSSALSEPALTGSASGSSLLEKEIAVLTDQGISSAQALEAIRVRGFLTASDIVRKTEAAMGAEFGGVWFEPATAQLHVGATSAAGRKKAKAVATQTGLAANVTVTTVRSTMATLLATQRQWNAKLADLFAHDQVKTGIEPQHNAVSITLSSSVPSSELAAIKREAAAANANVLVTVSKGASIGFVPLAKTECKTWVSSKAYCNPSLTPGVTILGTIKCTKVANQIGANFYLTEEECEERAKVGKKGEWEREIPICSAGPEAITNAGERVVLTAGHCIDAAKETWYTKNKAEAESTFGKVENFVFGGAAGAKKGDYADLSIEAAWQTGKPKEPVFAVTAEWKKMNEKKEETSYPVKAEQVPIVNTPNCHVGQTSGESCGEIKMTNVTVPYEAGHIVEGLVEATGANLIGEGGDSGGPWLTIEANQEALMEGLLSGRIVECIKRAKEEVGAKFFPTQQACIEDAGGGKGQWEQIPYECKKVAKVEKGAKFFKTEEECDKFEKAGEGEWELTPAQHLVFQPLTQPVGGATEGPMQALKLKLLTKGNEVLPPCGP